MEGLTLLLTGWIILNLCFHFVTCIYLYSLFAFISSFLVIILLVFVFTLFIFHLFQYIKNFSTYNLLPIIVRDSHNCGIRTDNHQSSYSDESIGCGRWSNGYRILLLPVGWGRFPRDQSYSCQCCAPNRLGSSGGVPFP